MNKDITNAVVYLDKAILQRLVGMKLLTEKEAIKTLKSIAEHSGASLIVS